MSEQTNTQSDDDQTEGTFVGGSFGRDGSGDDSGQELSTAEQLEAEDAVFLADAGEVPAEVAEQVTEPSGTDASSTDVEGVGTDTAPGDQNEPV